MINRTMIFWTTTVTVFGFYFLAQLGENKKEFSVPKSKLTIYCEAEFKEVEDQKTCLNDFEFAKISITQNPVQEDYFDLTYYDEYLALGNKLHGQRQTNNSPLKIMSVSELPEVFFEFVPDQKNLIFRYGQCPSGFPLWHCKTYSRDTKGIRGET